MEFPIGTSEFEYRPRPVLYCTSTVRSRWWSISQLVLRTPYMVHCGLQTRYPTHAVVLSRNRIQLATGRHPLGSVTSPLWKGRVGCCGWKDGGEGGGCTPYCTPCESLAILLCCCTAVLLYCTAVLLYSYGCTCCTVVLRYCGIAVLRYSCIACT